MAQDHSLWEHFGGGRLIIDAAILGSLGALEYAILSHPSAIQPGEGALLVMLFSGLLILGRRGIGWQHSQAVNAFLPDWAGRILAGSRQGAALPPGLSEETALASRALNAVLEEARGAGQALADLRTALLRDWCEVDACLRESERAHVQAREERRQAVARAEQASSQLRAAFEDTLQLDRIELDQRLRADQWRLQAQAFSAYLGQVETGLGQFENLLEELRDTFPRLLREGDALGRLANAGMRHGARLGMAVKGLSAHTPRLLEEAAARTDQFRQFRKAADELRDQAEALGRRMELFRVEALDRTRAFGSVQGSLQSVDHAAQQAGLLAVNAAILAQQGGGSAGIQAIGGRLRHLAGQTSRGAAEIERALETHARGLEHETAGLWDLQEVAESLLAGVQNLLRWAGRLDQQGQELERLLESEVVRVDHVRQLSEQAELALHEVGERSHAIETALGRLWGVEAKLLPELERLTRSGKRLEDSGGELSRISQQNIEEIWGILARHREIRGTEAYRQVVGGDLARTLAAGEAEAGIAARLSWVRASRESRLVGCPGVEPPRGICLAGGGCRYQLLGLDPLGRPEPSALAGTSWSDGGREWLLELHDDLKSEDIRMDLLDFLRHSDLPVWFPGLQMRIATEGVRLQFPLPFAQLPQALAGLPGLLPVDAEGDAALVRPVIPVPERIQVVLWTGPDLEPSARSLARERVHALAQEIPGHHLLLPEAPHDGERPPCPWVGEPLEAAQGLGDLPPFRLLDLDGGAGTLGGWRRRFLEAGGREDAEGGAVLAALRVSPVDPVLLLLQLFAPGRGPAGGGHPDLESCRQRLQQDVLRLDAPSPFHEAWALLEHLQAREWLLGLPVLEPPVR